MEEEKKKHEWEEQNEEQDAEAKEWERSYGNQIFIVWSTLPVATTLINFPASGAFEPFVLAASASVAVEFAARLPQARVLTKCPCACTTFTHRPVVSSQTRMV